MVAVVDKLINNPSLQQDAIEIRASNYQEANTKKSRETSLL